jgi:hypothetical protein
MVESERYKLPGIDQVLAELIQAEGNTLHSEVHKLINSVWIRKNCHSYGCNLLLCLFLKIGIKCYGNYRGLSLLPTT